MLLYFFSYMHLGLFRLLIVAEQQASTVLGGTLARPGHAMPGAPN
jgi:hypothetical protein